MILFAKRQMVRYGKGNVDGGERGAQTLSRAVRNQEKVRCFNAEPGKRVGNSSTSGWWVAQGAWSACGEQRQLWVTYFTMLPTNQR